MNRNFQIWRKSISHWNYPLLFAHRGCSRQAPENTLAAFRLAGQLGIPGVELDVHLCASGELVVIHDSSLERTTGVGQKVENCNWSEISGLDAGSWFDPRFSTERLPLLSEVFDLLGTSVYYDIEIKHKSINSSALEKALHALISDYHLEKNCLISSFNPFALRSFRKFNKKIPIALIYSHHGDVPWFLRNGEGRFFCHPDIIKPHSPLVHKPMLVFNQLLTATPIVPWTVNSIVEAAELIHMGVSGLISDQPEDLLSLPIFT